METFKVICKADGKNWEQKELKSWLGGLFKYSITIHVPGPDKEEVCIVTRTFVCDLDKDTYYNLAGYPYGGYNSKYFIKLDEFTETQKEIAKKTEPVLN